MPKVSVIIPVYNAEKYLDRCLDSIINAQIAEIKNEIILINDGSTDNSLRICKEYANKYDNISVFTQHNQGPSVARNLGLKHSKGDWITFVDSDDWVVEKYFNIIKDNISNYKGADILVFGYIKVSKSIEIKNHQFNEFNKVYEHEEVLKLLKNTIENEFLLYPWNKVYSSRLKIKFPEDIRLGEDPLLNLNLFYQAKKVVFINNYIYNYFENKMSITNQKYKPNLIENMENHFSKKLEFYNSKPELNKDFYFRDIARVNLEKTFYAFLGNIIAKEGGDFISDLKEIRKTKLIEFGFEHYKLYNIKVFKQRLTLWMLKNRMYYILKLMYKK